MMDSKTYFLLKEMGEDVSSLANIFENQFEETTAKQIHELQASIELGKFKPNNPMKTQEEFDRNKAFAKAITKGVQVIDDKLAENTLNKALALAPNGNVITIAEGYSEDEIEAYKMKLIHAIKNHEAGISLNPPHHIVLLSDEPDAIKIPYSSVLHGSAPINLKQIPEEGQKHRVAFFSSAHINKRGSNYTPPKKKRKKR